VIQTSPAHITILLNRRDPSAIPVYFHRFTATSIPSELRFPTITHDGSISDAHLLPAVRIDG
jgi:hypothetical protein